MTGEPDDSERTVIRPAPGGRNRPQAVAGTSSVAEPLTASDSTGPPIITSPLSAAATPLLQLLARFPSLTRPPDCTDLRERVLREMRGFERRAREAAIPMDLLRPAHYALCASIDDVVLNTPWGEAGGWSARTLVSAFHQELDGGRQFFDLLTRLRQDPGKFLPVIELMYLCLSLGFMGRYRPPQGDLARFDQLRHDVCALIIAQRDGVVTQLSTTWKGIDAPYQAQRRKLPLWVAAASCLGVLSAGFVFVSTELNSASDNIYSRLLAASPVRMPPIARIARVQPPPPPPPPVTAGAGLARPATEYSRRQTLAQAVSASSGTAATPVIRIANRGLFSAGNAALQSSACHCLRESGQHLRPSREPSSGRLYRQSAIRTVAFPSNFQLSLARAQAARTVVRRTFGMHRGSALRGRADADPVVSNATAEGREQNRRIEFVLHRQDQQD